MNIFKKILAIGAVGVLLSSNVLPCFASAYKKEEIELSKEKNYSYNTELNMQNNNENNSKDIVENEEDEDLFTEEYKEFLNLSEEEKEEIEVIPRKYEVSFDGFFNNINNEEKKETVLIEDNNLKKSNNRESMIVNSPEDENGENNNNTNLPESYNLKNDININVEYQGNYGLCWDFASVKSLETYLSLNGYGDIDFSELHVDYLTSKEFGGWRDLHDGGNFYEFEQYLCQTNGPVYEEEVPYDAVYNTDSYDYLLSLDKKAYVYDTVNLPSIYKYLDENNNIVYSKYYLFKDENGKLEYTDEDIISAGELESYRNYVKSHIMQNGGLYCVIATPDPWVNYLNTTNSAEYFSGDTNDLTEGRTVHAVTVVGWDDNYSKENFNEGKRPINDGAYIVLNSWGEGYGNQGYYYVSYDDYYIESQLSGIKSASTELSEDKLIKIDFEDINLYNSLKEELNKYNIIFDDEKLEISLTDYIIKDIRYLSLIGKEITNISGLEKFEYLSMLDLSQNEIENIDSLQGENVFRNLNFLFLSQNKLQEIQILDDTSFPCLEQLDLSQNLIQDIDLSGLHELDYLNISDNDVSDISFINNLENLDFLEAKNNNIEEFPELNANAYSLVIELSGNKNLDLSTLDIANLLSLDLANCNIDDEKIEDLPSNESLRYLNLSNNQISNFNFLSKFNLELLDISYTDIPDLTGLVNNEYAQSITDLYASGIESISGIESMSNLNSLVLDDCNSVDLNKIEDLDNLMYLSLKNCNITTIDNLTNLSELFELNLDNNPNLELSSIKDFNSLGMISLENCGITDIIDVISNINLSDINLSNNNIENINALSEIEDRYLSINLSNNRIKSIPDMGDKIHVRLENQNVEEYYELEVGKTNYIEFPDIIDFAYNESTQDQIVFECENCELDLDNQYIKIYSEHVGQGQAKIKIDGGSLDGSYYTINYNMVENIPIIGIETEYTGRVLFVEGENFELENLKVYVVYDNGLMGEITDYEIEGNTDLEVGQENVKITYQDYEAIIGIYVYSEDDVKIIKFNEPALYNSFKLSTYDYESGLIYSDDENLEIIITKELCDSVKELEISDKISDLTGISEFSNLELLFLEDYNSTDLSEIVKLQNLMYLKINNFDNKNSRIEDISELNSLTNLNGLILWNTNVKDVDDIYNSLNIDFIEISSNYELDELENDGNIVYLPEYFGEMFNCSEHPIVRVTFNCNIEEHEVKIDENQKYYIELDNNEYENFTSDTREAYINLFEYDQDIGVFILISYNMKQNQDEPISDYGYEVRDNLVINVKSKTGIEDFTQKFMGERSATAVLFDKDDNELGDDVTYVGTGMKIRFKAESGVFILDENNNPITYIITVKGDINGDGIAGDVDALLLKAYRNELQGYELNEEQIEAIDINSDEIINYIDSNLLKLHRMEVEGYNLDF